MAARLKNILRFTAVPAGGQDTLIHGLADAGDNGLVPDVVMRSDGSFSIIAADDATVTVQNDGAVVADCDVLVEHWHTVEREFGTAFGDPGEALVPQPFIPAAGGASDADNVNSAPVNTTTRTIIYVRSTGNDTTGNGTLLAPYLTIDRALLDIPRFVDHRYVIDLTGYGTYTFSANFYMPTFVSTVPLDYNGSPDFPDFYYEAPVTFQAVPTVVQTIQGGDFVSNVLQGVCVKLLTTTAAFTPNAFQGHFLSFDGSFGFPIIDNDATTITYVSEPGGGLAFPLRVYAPSCVFSGVSWFTTPQQARIQFNGIAWENTTMFLNQGVMPGFEWTRFDASTIFACDCSGTNVDTPQGLGMSFTGACIVNFTGVSVFDWKFVYGENFQLQAYNSGVSQFQNAQVTPSVSTGVGSQLTVNLVDFVDGNIGIGGGTSYITDVYFSGTVPGTSSAVLVSNGPGARVYIDNATGTGLPLGNWTGDYGVFITGGTSQGTFVEVSNTVTVPGAVSDVQVGALAARTWADFRANPPLRIQSDVDPTAYQSLQSTIVQP